MYLRKIKGSGQDFQHIHTQSCVPRARVVLVTYCERVPLSKRARSKATESQHTIQRSTDSYRNYCCDDLFSNVFSDSSHPDN